MSVSRLHQRPTGWLLLLSMLWGVLAPLVAQASVSADRDGARIQICTSTGMAWVQVDANQDGPSRSDKGFSNGSMTLMGECAWCVLHGGGGALPTQEAASLPLMSFSQERPHVLVESLAPDAAWLRLPSRAPPPFGA